MAQARTPQASSFFATRVAGIGFCLLGLLVLTAAAEGIHPALPGVTAGKVNQSIGHKDQAVAAENHGSVTSEKAAAAAASPGQAGEESAEKTLPFQFSLAGDPELSNSQIFVLKLKRLASAPWPVGEALVWWTLPGGRKISIPLKQVSDDVWASRVALEKPAGRNGLTVMILGDSGRGRLSQTLELDYEAELPAGTLKFLGQGELDKKEVGGASDVKPEPETRPLVMTAREKKEKSSWSLQTVVILIGIANLALLFPVLLLARILRRFLGGTDPDGEAARLLYSEIFSGAGLIESVCGVVPAPEDPERTEPAPEAAKPVSREMFEATILEPPAAAPMETPQPKKAAAEKDKSSKDGSLKDATLGGDGQQKVDLADLSF